MTLKVWVESTCAALMMDVVSAEWLARNISYFRALSDVIRIEVVDGEEHYIVYEQEESK